jgi:hypothetical protein
MEGVSLRYRNVHFVLDSTRWQEIQNRGPGHAPARALFGGGGRPSRKTFGGRWRWASRTVGSKARMSASASASRTFRFSPEALGRRGRPRRIPEGRPPSSHLSLIDSLAEDASTRFKNTRVTIGREHVLRLVAMDLKISVKSARDQLFERLGGPGRDRQREDPGEHHGRLLLRLCPSDGG